MGALVDSEMRLHFAPTTGVPPRFFDHPRRRYGKLLSTPPYTVSVGTKTGARTPRRRRTIFHEPKTSMRSVRPNAAVNPMLFTSVRPCRSSQFARNSWNDALCVASVSAVGTNHRPVSPKKVGNPGLVSVLVWELLAG